MTDLLAFLPTAVSAISIGTTIWLAVRTSRTNNEVENLKARLAQEVEETKSRLAHRAAIDLANREGKLDRVSLQLKELYGPLYALSHASHRAWVTFRSAHGPRGTYWGQKTSPPSDADAAAWRLWMTTVFMPLNLEMERLVLSNVDLLFGEEMDDSLLDMCAHVEAYKTVIERWKSGDFSVNTTPLDFPGDALRKYVGERFVELRREQQRLLSDVYDTAPVGAPATTTPARLASPPVTRGVASRIPRASNGS